MKKLFLFFLIVLISSVLFAQLTYWPKNTLAELFTTTQCSTCPDAYAGLEVLHNQYDYSEFNSIRYYSSQGGGMYGSETVEPVYDYYGVNFTPQVYFNGTYNVPGGGPEIEDGSEYLNVVTPHYYETSPLKMRIISFDSVSGDVSVGVTLMDEEADLTDAIIRFALIEDNVSDLHTRIVRYISKSNLNMGNVGQEIVYDKTLQVSTDFVQENLHVVSFVQLPNHQIIQSVSSYSQPYQKIRVAVPFNQSVWDQNYDSSDPYYMYEGEFFSVVNTGTNTITVNVSCEMDNSPDGWDISFCDHSNCYIGTATVDIPAGGTENFHDFHVVLFPSSNGEATYHFTITVPDTDINYTVPFYYSTSASAHGEVIAPNPIATLYPAFPNPFLSNSKSEITIKYSLMNGSSPVKLAIYNLKGQLVRNLVSGIMPAGSYDVKWDLKTKNGNFVSNGVYLYVLDINGKIQSKKITIIK